MTKDRIPDLLVEQLALDELPAQTARSVRERLEAEDDPRLTALSTSNAEILETHPPEVVARRIRHRLERVEDDPSTRRFGWWFATVTVAAAAAAVLAWWMLSPTALTPTRTGIDGEQLAVGPTAPDTVRIKGDAALMLYKREGARKVDLTRGDTVAKGDSLAIAYRSGGAKHGVIVSLDGAGAATLHFPADEAASTALAEHGNVQLPHAFDLDDAPGFERFFFVTADAPLAPAAVLDAVRKHGGGADPATAPLAEREGWQIVDFDLRRAR